MPPISVLIAGPAGALATWLQLYRHLTVDGRSLRVFGSSKSASTFFVLTVLVAGAVSTAVALLTLTTVGGSIAGVGLGIGASVPIATPPDLSRANETPES